MLRFWRCWWRKLTGGCQCFIVAKRRESYIPCWWRVQCCRTKSSSRGRRRCLWPEGSAPPDPSRLACVAPELYLCAIHESVRRLRVVQYRSSSRNNSIKTNDERLFPNCLAVQQLRFAAFVMITARENQGVTQPLDYQFLSPPLSLRLTPLQSVSKRSSKSWRLIE